MAAGIGLTVGKIGILAVKQVNIRLTSCSMYIRRGGKRSAAKAQDWPASSVRTTRFGKVMTRSDRGLVRMTTDWGAMSARAGGPAGGARPIRFVNGITNLPADEAVNNSVFGMELQS